MGERPDAFARVVLLDWSQCARRKRTSKLKLKASGAVKKFGNWDSGSDSDSRGCVESRLRGTPTSAQGWCVCRTLRNEILCNTS